MRRTQVYVTDDQQRRIAEIAADRGVSKAAVIRALLDGALGQSTDEFDARAAIEATAGICADYPDWPEWLREVRGATADERLSRLGL
jgi:hypothetical protein